MLSLSVFFSVKVSASYGAYAYYTDTGIVTEVIDGDAIKIFTNNKETKYVRLIGVDTQGYDLAFQYMNNEILGKTVSIALDTVYSNKIDIWTHAYVYCNGTLVNNVLLEKGYGKLNSNYSFASKYNSMKTFESFAKQKNLGIWCDGLYSVDNSYDNYLININTASRYMLKTYLYNISDELAREIISYRDKYGFSKISDIKKVDGFTSEIYQKNIDLMTLKTNINKATFEELVSLSLTDNEANNIIKYRESQNFRSKAEIYRNELISYSKYKTIADYIYY